MRTGNAVQSWPSGKCPEGVFVEGAEVTALAVAAIVGTLTDTVLVLSAIGLLSQWGVVVTHARQVKDGVVLAGTTRP